jgi:hypothetical protein
MQKLLKNNAGFCIDFHLQAITGSLLKNRVHFKSIKSFLSVLLKEQILTLQILPFTAE